MNHHRTLVPPIKCQGIKTRLVSWIRAAIPADFAGTWIEPFMGSGVVAFNVRPQRALLADSNPHLINFYKAIADGSITSVATRRFLEREGAALLHSGGEHYYVVRERFNQRGDPMDFLFLNRACFNGLIRFNQKGGFNVPFCRKPNRFAQAYISRITNQVQAISDLIRFGSYKFLCQDFTKTIAAADDGDFIYCDPPYIDRHADYFSGWSGECEGKLAGLLSSAPCKFILSTWHGNEYRRNVHIDGLWSKFSMLTREHFYHVGAKEDNRNPMLEALVMNYQAVSCETRQEGMGQPRLFGNEAARGKGKKPPSCVFRKT